MPDRIIRDEALNSDRLLGLKRNTHRLAFVACVLEADDLGNFEAGPGALWRLWRDWLALTDRTQVAEIVLALSDADLIRLYEVDGKRYAHIPKFRQRLRYVNGKHPRPPATLECNEINEVLQKRPTEGGPQSYHGRATDGRREEKRREEKRRTAIASNAIAFDAEGGRWQGISESDEALWRAAFPAVNVVAELNAAAAWARANPSNRKSNWRRFLTNWLKRAQDRAPRAPTPTPRGKVAL